MSVFSTLTRICPLIYLLCLQQCVEIGSKDSPEKILFNDFRPADRGDFVELRTRTTLDSLFHDLRPFGYATFPREKLLEFRKDDAYFSYPPFTYHGLYGPTSWHTIPAKYFLQLRNRSFMQLKHPCEQNDLRADTKVDGSGLNVESSIACKRDQYPKLPSCSSPFQSPIDIKTNLVSASGFLPNYDFANFEVKLEFMMSLPWDGTNLLTVETLSPVKSREDSISHHINVANLKAVPTAIRREIPLLPEISSGAVTGGTLYFDRMYIKYGALTNIGSEHQINGKSFAMELQFLFSTTNTNLEKYWHYLFSQYLGQSVGTTIESSYGKNVHIISVFVEVVSDEAALPKDAWNRTATNEFKILSAAARHFWTVHNQPYLDDSFRNLGSPYNETKYRSRGFVSKSDLTYLTLKNIIPPIQKKAGNTQGHSPYYSYRGSITHPPCFENIDYGVYEQPIFITQKMWNSFRFIPSQFDDTRFVAGNFRPIKSIYRRATDLKTIRNLEKVEATQKMIDKTVIRKSSPEREVTKQNEWDYYEKAGCRCKQVNICCIILIVFVHLLGVLF